MTARPPGLRANLTQLVALVAMTVLVGGMVGQERTVVPLIAEQIFGLRAFTTALTFIATSTALVAVRMREPLGSTEWTAVSEETP